MAAEVPAAFGARPLTPSHEPAIATARPAGIEGTWTFERRLHWVLRIAVAMCFIGHGAFGLITKAEWVPYFAVVGISRDLAFALMPIVGTVDVLIGVAALVSPRPAILMYMAVWALWTALLRPLSGDSIWETLERAGNYGVPLAFLLTAGPYGSLREWVTRARWRDWLAPARDSALRPATVLGVARVLGWTTGLLLIGHGVLGAFEGKAQLAQLWGAAGIGAWAVPAAGWLELIAGVAVILRPSPVLLSGVALWKVATELLFPIAGAPVWEFIERGGSYGAPVALALVLIHFDRNILQKRGGI